MSMPLQYMQDPGWQYLRQSEEERLKVSENSHFQSTRLGMTSLSYVLCCLYFENSRIIRIGHHFRIIRRQPSLLHFNEIKKRAFALFIAHQRTMSWEILAS